MNAPLHRHSVAFPVFSRPKDKGRPATVTAGPPLKAGPQVSTNEDACSLADLRDGWRVVARKRRFVDGAEWVPMLDAAQMRELAMQVKARWIVQPTRIDPDEQVAVAKYVKWSVGK